jgi:hypothetical protein
MGVATPDPRSTLETVWNSAVEFWKDTNLEGGFAPVVMWDCAQGPQLYPEYPHEMKSKMTKLFRDAFPGDLQDYAEEPVMFLLGRNRDGLGGAASLPKRSIVVMHDMQELLTNMLPLRRAVWLMRDRFMANGRCLLMLSNFFKLPAEISQDTEVIDEPLPDTEELLAITVNIYTAFEKRQKERKRKPPPKLAKADLDRYTEALRGLSSFAAAQVVSLSLSEEGISLEALWDRKKGIIEQTRGLSVHRGKVWFKDMGGMESMKIEGTRIIKGRRPPNLVVWIDEIDKSGISHTNESSGVNSDAQSVILQEMEDNDWDGLMILGPGGTSKSMFAKAFGTESGAPVLRMDFGEMQDMYVGQSQGLIRNAVKIEKAMGGKNVFFVATCNDIDSITGPMRRRFRTGIYFSDLPDVANRKAIWKIQMKAYELPDQDIPADALWTGAEIRNCCAKAWEYNITLKEAAERVVPLALSDSDTVNSLRGKCAGRYLDANKTGTYKGPEASTAEQLTGRLLE